MKSKVHTQFKITAPPIPVVSELAVADTSVAAENDFVTDTQIKELAYKLYEQRGRVDGSDLQDWFEAESILRNRTKLAA
jgi:hypothetical protein